MTQKKELRTAYILAIVLFFAGVAAYAAFSGPAPEQPVRLMFKNAAGKVLFDHKIHADNSGYGIDCAGCHHHPGGDDSLTACGSCHEKEKSEAAPGVCLDCHDADEIDAGDLPIKTDAFHKQCIGCHEEGDAGPGPKECKLCHVM